MEKRPYKKITGKQFALIKALARELNLPKDKVEKCRNIGKKEASIAIERLLELKKKQRK